MAFLFANFLSQNSNIHHFYAKPEFRTDKFHPSRQYTHSDVSEHIDVFRQILGDAKDQGIAKAVEPFLRSKLDRHPATVPSKRKAEDSDSDSDTLSEPDEELRKIIDGNFSPKKEQAVKARWLRSCFKGHRAAA